VSQRTEKNIEISGAEALLRALKFHGVDYLFANAGTDFPPIIESLATLSSDEAPQALTIPHETASVAMAHGFYLVTGKPQAVMVHVNVGLANAVMGVINAASDNIPMLVMSGRTPITELGRKGGRMTPIQYGQEMFNQASLLSDLVKFHYEMRYPEQAEPLVSRALASAKSAPEGPSYLSLPREPLTETFPRDRVPIASQRPAASPANPAPETVKTAAEWLKSAQSPVILVQRGDPAGDLSKALQALTGAQAIPVAEPFSIRNVMPSAHPMFIGHDVKSAIAGADVILVLDCDIPWIEALHKPAASTRIIHVGSDPHFLRMPIRGYQTDLAIQSEPTAFVEALQAEMTGSPGDNRRQGITAKNQQRREKAKATALTGCTAPMSAEWLSKCISDVMDERAVVFSELGVLPGMMELAGPNLVFNNPHSGGLGWAMPAALGAQLADRDRLTIACIGDGSYMFANPVVCHQIAEALNLPILTIIKNNGIWNAVRRSVVSAYPDGAAARTNTMPLTSLQPAPEYIKIAEASRAYVEKVEHGRDLPGALERAVNAIRQKGRQAVLDVQVEISDIS
jgi:acetolactate synthase I/II/III large subunit